MKVFAIALLLVAVLASQASAGSVCTGRTTCDTCTSDTQCGWCMNTVRGTAECLPGNANGPTTEWCAEWRFLKSQVGNPVGGFPFKPSELDVYLVPDEQLEVELEFTLPPQDTLPLDVFILQDNSASMGDEIDDLFALIPKLVNGVIEFQFDAQFGIAAYIDHKRTGYTGVHAYRFLQGLTHNYNVVAKTIGQLASDVHGNYDFFEMGYDAFLYAGVGGPIWDNLQGTTLANCPKPGWRADARHVAIMISDAMPKAEETYDSWPGEFISGTNHPRNPDQSRYHPNNNDCVMDFIASDGYINSGNSATSGEFHVSVAAVADIFSPSNQDIYPIFFTPVNEDTSGGKPIRDTVNAHMSTYFGRGKWGDIRGAVGLDELVIEALEEIASTINPEVTSDPSGFYVASTLQTESNSCAGGENVPGCVFVFSLDLLRSGGNTAEDDVVVRVPGFGATAIATLHVTNHKFFCDGCDLSVPNSVVDHCGICNGNNASCTDCYGVVVDPGQPILQYDACGVCDGDGSSCWDCLLQDFSTSPDAWRLDFCGICRAQDDPLWNTTCLDCNFQPPPADARVDACGVCGGTNACLGCDGQPPVMGVVAMYDACGVCGGDNSTCLGCDGNIYPGGIGIVLNDPCGVCNGDSTSCAGCPDDTLYPPQNYDPDNLPADPWPPVVDICGVCGGDNSSCTGCDGIVNSTWTIDICGVCGDGTQDTPCVDCTGLAHGTSKLDACDICGGSKTDPDRCNVPGEDPAVIVGAAVGSTVAAVACAVGAFLLYMRYKNPNWYFQDALDNLEATQSHNPLYESAGTEKSNPLYTGGS